jgi:hypothetical protein
LGETLARDTLFLFFTGLFQQFSFQLDPHYQNSNVADPNPTFILAPREFKVIITNRI